MVPNRAKHLIYAKKGILTCFRSTERAIQIIKLNFFGLKSVLVHYLWFSRKPEVQIFLDYFAEQVLVNLYLRVFENAGINKSTDGV